MRSINFINMKYVCDVCGWVYDPAVGVPEAGIPAGTPWEEVPEDFVCPLCGVGKDEFSAEYFFAPCPSGREFFLQECDMRQCVISQI